jgi:hypothetical protein
VASPCSGEPLSDMSDKHGASWVPPHRGPEASSEICLRPEGAYLTGARFVPASPEREDGVTAG